VCLGAHVRVLCFHDSLLAWIVMGTLVAIIVVLAGTMITILLIIIFVLWKR
jgi:hypothetical protein